jgi:YegS/Rv2252/BmrU family lipid kinase
MSENKKVLFIINKHAGTGYRSALEGRILNRCEQFDIEPTIQFTERRNHATELAKEATESRNYEVIFAVGGDGTVNEVAQGIVGTTQVMGILPKGSGNGLARHLGIPMSLKKSVDLIGSSSIIEMDSFLVNGKLSLNVSGIGFDGHVASLFGKDGNRGLVGYGTLVIKEFMNYNEFDIHAEIDHKEYDRRAFIIALANSSQFGNNARVAPHASVCDGLLDICFVKKVPLIQSPAFAQKMFSGKIDKSSFVEILKAKSIKINFNNPMAFHIDGEPMEPAKNFEIKIQPSSLKMVVPQTEMSL